MLLSAYPSDKFLTHYSLSQCSLQLPPVLSQHLLHQRTNKWVPQLTVFLFSQGEFPSTVSQSSKLFQEIDFFKKIPDWVENSVTCQEGFWFVQEREVKVRLDGSYISVHLLWPKSPSEFRWQHLGGSCHQILPFQFQQCAGSLLKPSLSTFFTVPRTSRGFPFLS